MRRLYNIREVDFRHEDSRGCLTQLVHEGFQQINVLETTAGVIRGGHFHKLLTEAFYVLSGEVEVELSRADEGEKTTFHAGDFFEIEPYTLHSMFFPADCVMVQMYNRPVEQADGSKDIYSAEAFLRFAKKK